MNRQKKEMGLSHQKQPYPMAVIHGLHGIAAIVLFDRKLLYFLSNKNPPGDAHSRDKKMSLMRPRSAREFRKRNSLLRKNVAPMA